MFLYQVKTAFQSLRRNPILSLLLIGGIALGICVSTAFVTLRHMYMQDPLPGKSKKCLPAQASERATASRTGCGCP